MNKPTFNEKAFVYDGWESAVTDAIAEGMADNITGQPHLEDLGPEVILDDDFGDTEKSIVKYLKETPGLYIIYTRWPLRLIRMWWRRITYIFRKRGK